MYSNNAIRGLKKMRKNLNRDQRTEAYKKQIKNAIQILRSSHAYWMGDYEDFRDRAIKRVDRKSPFSSPDVCHVVMPFDSIVVFFSFKRRIHGIIVERVGLDLIRLQYIFRTSDGQHWTILPIYDTYACEGKSLVDAGVKVVDPEKYPGTNLMRANTAVGHEAEKVDDKIGKMLIGISVAITNYFFCMRNIKNIIDAVVEKERPKTRKASDKDTNLFEYRILELKRPRQKKLYRYTHQQIESRKTQPFQEISGHEKTYYEDAPRFGRLKDGVGTFIIGSYCKGEKDKGFVTRDYDVTKQA
ncbi:MAG: hypothetical protein R3267_07530 [Paenisporosarcina sp.]|nr:hypothetical protein [Paenisporosarcina sp.]